MYSTQTPYVIKRGYKCKGEIEGDPSSPQDPAATLLETTLSPKEKTEIDQLRANLRGCCVRRELEGRRSDQKHGGSRILDLLSEPTVVITAAHTPLLQVEN